MVATHEYTVSVEWTGNLGTGTSSYRAYGRDNEVTSAGKIGIAGSSDPAFRGDASRWNPEELLVASLAQCHMLQFLHLAAVAGVRVVAYADSPVGRLTVERDGGGCFDEVVLHPSVAIDGEVDAAQLEALHDRAHELCFVARSVNFPVRHEAVGTSRSCAAPPARRSPKPDCGAR